MRFTSYIYVYTKVMLTGQSLIHYDGSDDHLEQCNNTVSYDMALHYILTLEATIGKIYGYKL